MFREPTRFANASIDVSGKADRLCARPGTTETAVSHWQRPLDWGRGHPSFFAQMFQLLDGIKAINLEPDSTIIEVGSGGGWATEWLAALRYRVVSLELSQELIDLAMQRVRLFLDIHQMSELYSNVSWRCATIEDAALDDESADAVLFLGSFQFTVDETKALANAYRILRRDGTICILNEPNWIPGNTEQEGYWRRLRESSNIVVSPFTANYLTHILDQAGFSDLERYHAVNRLVPVDRDEEPVRNFTHLDAHTVNLFTARKVNRVTRPSNASSGVTPQVHTKRPPIHDNLLQKINSGLHNIDWRQGALDYVAHYFEKYGGPVVETLAFTKPLSPLTRDDPTGSLKSAVSYVNNFANTIDLLRLEPGAWVLDVACGAGWFSHWCAKLGYRAYGVDISADFIDLARRRVSSDPHLDVSKTEAKEMFDVIDLEVDPLPSSKRGIFDAAVLESCLHHFFDPITALSHVVNGLNDDGVVLIIEGENRIGPIKDEYMQVMLETHTLERPYPRDLMVKVLHRVGLVHFEFLGAVNGYFASSSPLVNNLTELVGNATLGANICLCAKTAEALRRAIPSYCVSEQPQRRFIAGASFVDWARRQLPAWARPIARWVWYKARQIIRMCGAAVRAATGLDR